MKRPTPQQVREYALSIGYDLDGEEFCDFYESKGWLVGKSPMKDWQAAVRTWKRRSNKPSTNCIVDHKKGYKYQVAPRGQNVWLCEECYKYAPEYWANYNRYILEWTIEKNKATSTLRKTPKKKLPEMEFNDKRRQEIQKLTAETAKNLSKG